MLHICASRDKVPVVGMMERKGKVIAKVVPGVTQNVLQPLVIQHVNKEATLISDNFWGYRGLDKNFAQHEIINHTYDEYVRGNVHTNSIEGFWAIFKRGIYGIYHFASPKHLQRYVDEFSYRFNSREITDSERFELAVGRCGNARIRYNTLIDKKPV
jgi:transposase-like protein